MLLTSAIIRNILFASDELCCLCLKTTGEDAFHVYDEVTIENKVQSTVNLTNILGFVFSNKITECQYISSAVCKECYTSVLSAYKFIKQCSEINETISNSICNLLNKLDNTDVEYVGKLKGMFVAMDQDHSHIAVYYDSRKTVKSASRLIKRFQTFIRAEIVSNKNNNSNCIERKKSHSSGLERLYCELCGRSYKNKYVLKKHMLKNCKYTKNSNACDNDDYNGCNIDDLWDSQTKNPFRGKSKNKIQKYQESKKSCNYCNQSYKSKKHLQIHIHNQCKNAPNEVKIPVCKQCGKVVDKNDIELHKMSHSMEYECLKCGKIFRKALSFKKHLLIPNCNEKPVEFIPKPKKFSCHICGHRYVLEKTLKVHMAARHVGKGFPCKICKKKLSKPQALKDHMVVHTKEKKFMCSICGGKFVSKHSLLYHTRTHTGEKPYKCKYCDDRFLSASRRGIHTRMHHMAPQLECKYCSKKFTNWGGLSRHRKRHFNPASSLYLDLELDCKVEINEKDISDNEN